MSQGFLFVCVGFFFCQQIIASTTTPTMFVTFLDSLGWSMQFLGYPGFARPVNWRLAKSTPNESQRLVRGLLSNPPPLLPLHTPPSPLHPQQGPTDPHRRFFLLGKAPRIPKKMTAAKITIKKPISKFWLQTPENIEQNHNHQINTASNRWIFVGALQDCWGYTKPKIKPTEDKPYPHKTVFLEPKILYWEKKISILSTGGR